MGRLRPIFIVSYNHAWEGWVGKLTTDGVSLACQVRSLALIAHMLQMFNTRMFILCTQLQYVLYSYSASR